MKIVQTPVRFYPAVGGVEKYVFDLSVQLTKAGHRITVVCANEPPSENCEVQGIDVRRLYYLMKVADTNITPSLFFRLMTQKYDLIHTHFPTPWSAEISLICAKIKKKPCILTYHNDVEKTGLLGLITRFYNSFVLNFLLSQVDKILVTQSRYIEDSRFLPKYRNKIAVITNGITELPTVDRSIRGKATLLFVGLLNQHHRYKGLEHLIKALRLLRKDWEDVRLEVVGKGELVDEYEELAVHLGVADCVRFWGYVEDCELSKLYQSSTLFVLPSVDLHEGFGIVLLEAMAHSLPVITTEVVGISNEIRDHDAGLIVPPRDPESIAKAVNTLFSNPIQSQQMGLKGRELIRKKFLWKDIAKEIVKIYEEMSQ